MKNSSLFILIFGLILISFGCKTKQQTVALTSAHAEAGGRNSSAVRGTRPAVNSTNEYDAPAYGGDIAVPSRQAVVVSEPEEVRDEKFTLDADEKNTEAIRMKYHVVVGSFKNRDNAKKLQATLNSEGNKAVIVVNEHGMYRVLLASYNEYMEARGRINKINNRFPDAWVLVQKED